MSKQRLLVVDDTMDILRTLELILGQTYEVITATDGVVGYTKAMKYLPDLIILDIMMPKMNGYQLCDQIKKSPYFKDIPVIFLSAKGTPIDKEYGIKKGAAAYVPKPFEPGNLIKTIEELLKNNPPKPVNRPSYDDYIREDGTNQSKVKWAG